MLLTRRSKRTEPETEPEAPAKSPLDEAIERLGPLNAVAVQVLRAIDHPMSTGATVAAAIELDPVLTSQVLRVANSASFGVLSTVSTTVRAVAVVGMPGVRSIAAVSTVQRGAEMPPGFWEHSAATAAGCVAASSAIGVSKDEAFSMGLLHDLGWAILDVLDPDTHRSMTDVLDDATLCAAEELAFGASHAQIAGRLLESWNFPATIVEAIGAHHLALDDHRSTVLSPHTQVLLIGDALAHRLLAGAGYPFAGVDLGEYGFSEPAIEALLELTDEYMRDIVQVMPR